MKPFDVRDPSYRSCTGTPVGIMTMDRDLSAEFLELVSTIPAAEVEPPAAAVPPTPTYVYAFHSASSEVVRCARLSRHKIDHLSALVRRSSIYEDPAQEIAALMHAINDEVTKASQELKGARRQRLEAGWRPGDTTESSKHCAAMEAQALREVEETSGAFKHVLQLRTDSVKELTERKDKFSRRSLEKKERPKRSRVPVFDNLPRPEGTTETTKAALPQQQMDLLIPDQTYHVARADAATDIEAQVQEIGAIFGKLATLVRQQDEQVERIETNVEEAAADVDRARNVLVHSLNNMNTTTKTALKCAGIITTSLLIYTIVFA